MTKDDIFENSEVAKAAERTQQSLVEQHKLRLSGDPTRLRLDKILSEKWGREFDQNGELIDSPTKSKITQAIAAE